MTDNHSDRAIPGPMVGKRIAAEFSFNALLHLHRRAHVRRALSTGDAWVAEDTLMAWYGAGIAEHIVREEEGVGER